MNEILMPFCQFFSLSSILMLLGAILFLFFLLLGWGKLWNTQWPCSYRNCLWGCACVALLPMFCFIRADIAEMILEKGPRVFKSKVERQLNISVERFLLSYACRCENGEIFIRSAIPEYAVNMVQHSSFSYLPIDRLEMNEIVNDKRLQSILWNVYVSRFSSENGLDEEAFDYIHKMVVLYLSEQQFLQNKDKLKKIAEYSVAPLLFASCLITMTVTAMVAYMDINKRYCQACSDYT